MKLRLRSLESKQTHKIEVPYGFNLQQLKESIILHLSPSSSSSSSAPLHNLLLSLNRKEELCGSSPEDSLQSLGVTSGDLIYYSSNPFAFSSQTPNLSHAQDKSQEISTINDQVVDLVGPHIIKSGKFRDLMDTQIEGALNLSNPSDHTVNLGITQMIESSKVDELVSSRGRTRELMDTQVNLGDHTGNLGNTQMIESSEVENSIGSSGRTRELMDAQVDGSSNLSDFNEENPIDFIEEGVDEMEVDDESGVEGNKYSVPSFLKKVFVKEVGDAAADDGGDHKLLVIAVHAVLLESGFVGYDPVSGMKIEGFHLAVEWPSLAFGMTLQYTLPEVSTSEVVDTVVLKFQTMGKFVNVYGSLPKKGFGVHRVCLDEPSFLPALSFIWKRSDDTCPCYGMNDSRKLYPNQEIFDFWKIVKDGLSYPLLIDLCERVDIVPPPCFMRLPTELKLKILESLPAVDVARVECVCSEMRYIASNNDLWKLKYEEEFGNSALSLRECQWKTKFSSVWEIRKKRKRICRPLQFREPPHFRPFFPGRRDPNPLGPPFIIGGDYDRLPPFGLPQHPGHRIFRGNCDLGGYGL